MHLPDNRGGDPQRKNYESMEIAIPSHWPRAGSLDSFRTLYFTDDDLMSGEKPEPNYKQRDLRRTFYILRLSSDAKTDQAGRTEKGATKSSQWTTILSSASSTMEEVSDERVWEMLDDIDLGPRQNRFCRETAVCTIQCMVVDRTPVWHSSVSAGSPCPKPSRKRTRLRRYLTIPFQWRRRRRAGETS